MRSIYISGRIETNPEMFPLRKVRSSRSTFTQCFRHCDIAINPLQNASVGIGVDLTGILGGRMAGLTIKVLL